MQIDHLTFSKSGGAGNVATLLSSSQRAQGHDALLHTVSDGSLSDSPLRHPALSCLAAIDNFVIAKSGVPTLTSLTRRNLGTLALAPLRENSAVHFHWVEGVITLDQLRFVSRRSSSAVWTLHDMAPFTGFCHLSHGCRGFETGCTTCPQSRKPFQKTIEFSLNNRVRDLGPMSEKLKVVVPSEWMREKAAKSLVLKNFEIQVIFNPVSPTFYAKSQNNSIRSSLGIDEGEFVAVLVATDLSDPNKQVRKAIEVFLASLGGKFQKVRLVLIGKVGRGVQIQDSRLDFRGSLRELGVSRLMAAADVLLSTSIAESSGLTIAEAAASGTPALILGGDSGSRELVVDGITGIVAKTWRDFGQCLSWLARDRDRARELGYAASQFSHRFAPELVSQRYLNLYASQE